MSERVSERVSAVGAGEGRQDASEVRPECGDVRVHPRGGRGGRGGPARGAKRRRRSVSVAAVDEADDSL